MTLSPRPAPDPMGKAAQAALLAVTRLDFRLAIASSPNVTRQERADALALAFQQYRQIVRAFSELETVAPNAARLGFEADDRARDFAEERAA